MQTPTGREVSPAGQSGPDTLDLADLLVRELVPEAERERLAKVVGQLAHREFDGFPEFTIPRPLLRRSVAGRELIHRRWLMVLAVAKLLMPKVASDCIEPGLRRDIGASPAGRGPECGECLLSQVRRTIG